MYTLKKSLGQHFLKDQNIIDKIIAELGKVNFTQLLEVGPGAGALTKEILKINTGSFKAVEIDTEKANWLQEKYKDLDGKIINENFLETECPFDGEFTIIGNFPYNISSQILFKILDWKNQVPVVIGMFQKEVAQRIAAKHGNKVYGVLSALLQPHYNIEYLFDVPPNCFTPPPKVMSSVIKLTRVENALPVKSDKAYKILVKAAFNQRRKTMRNACKALFLQEDLKTDIFSKRAEQLSIEDFANLSFKMK